MYHIQGLLPVQQMGGYGFNIQLWPAWREAVSRCSITQDHVQNAIRTMGRAWLDSCGYDQDFDPDNCGAFKDSTLPLGPSAGKLFEPEQSIRISWGEWGPEHITVPGNACGLDIDPSGFHAPRRGKVLTPHNVDCWRQVQLLLMVFLWFADGVILQAEIAAMD